MTPEERKARLKEIREAVRDSTRNIHKLTLNVVRNRVMNRGWTLEEALTTPLMTRTQAAQRAAQNPRWRNFSIRVTDEEREKRKLRTWR